ncbi:hypothetical protein HDU76_001376 [Blyttiomyces sp. JEL0837]|nr:hypothetical protein HDU76_001376 [Blyttiomyces sp. JEL0837]
MATVEATSGSIAYDMAAMDVAGTRLKALEEEQAVESWIGSSGGSGGFTRFGSTGARMQNLVTRLDYNLYYSQVPLSGLAGLDLSGLEVRG